jgi:hypothetical protein
LSAATLRDFDEAISMVSHGCDSIEEFYAKISIGQSIDNVKTPVLFIEVLLNFFMPAFLFFYVCLSVCASEIMFDVLFELLCKQRT